METLVKHIMQTTQTPIYGLSVSGNISGEALKQLEIGLLGKVERYQRENTDAWKGAIKMLRDVQQTFKNEVQGTAPAFDAVVVNWKSPAIRDKNEDNDVLSNIRKNNPGLFPDDFYRQRIGLNLGLDEDTIKELGEQVKAEAEAQAENLFGTPAYETPTELIA